MSRAALTFRPGRRLALAIAPLVLAGCWMAQVEQAPDQGEIPGGPPAPPLGMPEAVGPVTEIGRGHSLGIGWRYLVYDSADGTCTTLDMGNGASSACGADLRIQAPLMVGGITSSSGTPYVVEGLASGDVAEVWIEAPGDNRLQAVLMPLARAGFEGQVFLAFLPPGVAFDSVIALDARGEVVVREPLALPCDPGPSAAPPC